MKLSVAGNLEVGLGEDAQGAKVGPGSRSTLQTQEELADGRTKRVLQTTWSSTMTPTLRGQAKRGQGTVLPEADARDRYPDLVVASLGAFRTWADRDHTFVSSHASPRSLRTAPRTKGAASARVFFF